MKQQLESRLSRYGQQHLLSFWDELGDRARRQLAEQINGVDFDLMARLSGGRSDEPDWGELAARAEPPPAIRRGDSRTPIAPEQARQRGEQALRAGEVGVILVAGGQGTRLGFPHPKGMLPLGPVSRRTLFQILCDHLRAVARRYQVSLPLFVMTSDATHHETIAFLTDHNYFGLPADEVQIFCQGSMPAVDACSGKILLAERDQLALSPDGHGGMLAALARCGGLARARRRGLRHLFYCQVDNPLVRLADAELIGYHVLAASEMTTQVAPKREPLERVGNVVAIDGRVRIIEYSDLPEAAARQRQADGSLKLWAGNIAVHVFDVDFLQRISSQADALPLHRALKKVRYIADSGAQVDPLEPNAIKYERFIFDLLPAAAGAIVVEVDPREAFAPVKNASGSLTDSPETAQQAMIDLHRRWLHMAGVEVARDVAVEINPLWALDAPEVARKVCSNTSITEPTYFC